MKKTIFLTTLLMFLGAFSFLYYYKKTHQPDLTVIGFVNTADGIGKQSLDLIKIFKDDFSLNFVQTRSNKFHGVPPNLKSFFKNDASQLGKVTIFEEILWWPGEEKYKKLLEYNNDATIKIAYSMFESSLIPQEWVIVLNEHFDAVAVPDKFLIKVYQDSGVTLPIFELPLGIHMDDLLKQPLKKERGKPFIFGNLSACSDRKNHIGLIRAFASLYGNNPDFQLRINCRYGEKDVLGAATKEIARLHLKNVIFTQFEFTREEYIETLKSFDCYVSPSKGEGFSIQPREAMALGIPTIVTNNTAQSTICESGLVKTVSSNIEEPAVYPWGSYYGFSYNCDEKDLALAMQTVAMNYDEYLAKGPLCRSWAKKYQFENLKAVYQNLVRPKTVARGPENKITAEGITTNSEALLKKYQSV